MHPDNNGSILLVILAVLLHASDESSHWSAASQHDSYCIKNTMGWAMKDLLSEALSNTGSLKRKCLSSSYIITVPVLLRVSHIIYANV